MVAERLHVSLATVYQLCAARQLRHLRLGPKRGAIRIHEQDLEQFLEACKADDSGVPVFPKHDQEPGGESL
jgi:excisionase family DNA binding protein